MAINLRKPPVCSVRHWALSKRAGNIIMGTDGVCFYILLVEIMDDKKARNQFREILDYSRSYFTYPESVLEHMEEAIRETVLCWFEGEINYCPHENLLLGFVTEILENGDCEETARALIYLLDKYCEEPEPETDGHYTGKVSE